MLLNHDWSLDKIDSEIRQRLSKIDSIKAEVQQLEQFKARKLNPNGRLPVTSIFS
ncbi:hypothetical protein SAMN02745119_00218 [Trichlorobacter thiogenes]|uniref:Uncharacterized protein n=1 Tax=Trichlorobacter thiogenes TaxID=115783 RepID=A0A1T4JZX5_9BACT|nr:hypothetical protein SAMN02745119_00218 [Trichlorobacter thiogenes]